MMYSQSQLINIGEIFDSFVSYSSFRYIHFFLEKFMERKLANNFTALFHATTATSLGFSYLITNKSNNTLWYLMKKFSSGYFLYDLHYILKHNKMNTLNIMYIYHHIFSNYIIHKNPNVYNGHNIIFWGELSNIPSYFVYYLLQQKPRDKKKIKLLSKIQFVLYATIRLPILSYYLLQSLKKAKDKTPIYSVIPIYIMGLFWTYRLGKKV